MRKSSRQRIVGFGANASLVQDGVVLLSPASPLSEDDIENLTIALNAPNATLSVLVQRTLAVAAEWVAAQREALPTSEVLDVALKLRAAFESALDLVSDAKPHTSDKDWRDLGAVWSALWGDEASYGRDRIRKSLVSLIHLTTYEGFGVKDVAEETTKAVQQLIDNWEIEAKKPAGKGGSVLAFYKTLFEKIDLRRPSSPMLRPNVPIEIDPLWGSFVIACSNDEVWKDALGRRLKPPRKSPKRVRLKRSERN